MFVLMFVNAVHETFDPLDHLCYETSLRNMS